MSRKVSGVLVMNRKMIKDGKVWSVRPTEAEYAARCKRLDTRTLMHIMNDAASAFNAMPDNHNAVFYLQEVSLCAAELVRRSHCCTCQGPLTAIPETGHMKECPTCEKIPSHFEQLDLTDPRD